MTDRKTDRPIVVWLRNDLRLDDNPALAYAVDSGRPVVPLLAFDEESTAIRELGGAQRWWFHHSIEALRRRLREKGSGLVLRRGRSVAVIREIVEECGASALWFNRRYDRAGRNVDDEVETALGGSLDVQRFAANLLHDPERLRTTSGGYYRVYGPFKKRLIETPPRDPIDEPANLKQPAGGLPRSDDLAGWRLLPDRPDWSGGLVETWTPGETSAQTRFAAFCDTLLADYRTGRERPGEDATSRMSPHLRWGEISPYRLWHMVEARAGESDAVPGESIRTFKQELLWRDFNYHLLFHAKALESENFDGRFDRFPWRRSDKDLEAWQRGMTGYPIVDAGMRQLWRTGWMHNRVRMIVGSFLTKDLLIDWREGERWFWDTLVDGDPASNSSQWQWIAGSGADAQPFFRIFNPVMQSRKFDRHGAYIRRWVPELRRLSDQAIHAPWEADEILLEQAGIRLGETYPQPIVDHGEARRRALAAYGEMKG